MSFDSSANDAAGRGLGARIHDALVGRPLDRGSRIILLGLNLIGLVMYGLGFLFFLLGAAMAAGTATPAMEVWIASMLWVLGIAAVSCVWVGLQLAFGGRWPWAVQYATVAALAVVVLLCLFAPPGIFSPRPGA